MIRGTWVQIPLRAITVFRQKLSSVEFLLTFSQFLFNLECESICGPPGDDTLFAQGIYLIDYIQIYIYYPSPPVNHMLIQRYHIEKLALKEFHVKMPLIK